jgi:hypothetical protein
MPTSGMTDQTLVNKLLSALFTSSTSFTVTPGTGGGSAFTVTPPYHLRLYSTTGSETASGTENTSGNSPGYTAGGSTLGSSAFGSFSSGASTNSNAVTWTASGTWTLGVAGIEVWDTAGTPIRYLWGALNTAIGASVVVSSDTVTFAIGSISVSGATW